MEGIEMEVLEMLKEPDLMVFHSLPAQMQARWRGHAINKIRGAYESKKREPVPEEIWLEFIAYNRENDEQITLDDFIALRGD